ncbi:MAG: UDP-glucose/GDP-mannose dehydrogenase family protein [Chloroflexi bacterium]|nr:UDP-glucose/GDP-mannose dehydrogenase family protein [Chloroflexota bacterium]
MTKTISVFGLGKLGFPIVACLASKGYRVIGYDLNPATIKAVNERQPNIHEPGLAELLEKVGDLSATVDYRYAVENSEVTFIVVPTPSQADGSFSTKYVEAAAGQIAEGIKAKRAYHLVVLTSTVLPGATEGRIKPLLEKVSGKKCGPDFGLCYSPEFIALGTVIRDFLYPDVILIGESDPKSGKLLSGIYQTVCQNNPPIVRTAIQNAELAKISLNAYVTMKITFANTLAELCERIPGGDAEAVSRLLGFDSRIGRKYLSGALAYGGPCFPRDNQAFAFFAKTVDCEARLAEATDRENEHQNERIVALVRQRLGEVKGKRIAVLGLTYKPETDVIEESAAIKISGALLQQGARLSVYDPAGLENARKVLGEKGVIYTTSAKACLKDADYCILTTPWNEFKSLKPADFIAGMKKPVLLDCWRFFDSDGFSEQMDYTAIGFYRGDKNEG